MKNEILPILTLLINIFEKIAELKCGFIVIHPQAGYRSTVRKHCELRI